MDKLTNVVSLVYSLINISIRNFEQKKNNCNLFLFMSMNIIGALVIIITIMYNIILRNAEKATVEI